MDPFFVRSKRRAEEVVASESSGEEGASSRSEVSETPNEKRVRLAREMLRAVGASEEEEQEEENVAKRLLRHQQQQQQQQQRGGGGALELLGARLARLACAWPELRAGADALGNAPAHVPTCLSSSSSSSSSSLLVAGSKGGALAAPGRVWRAQGDGRGDVRALCVLSSNENNENNENEEEESSLVVAVARRGAAAATVLGPGAARRELSAPGARAATALCCDERGSELVVGAADGTLRVFDVASGVCLGTHFGHLQQVHQLLWLAKDRVLSCSEDKTVHLWRLDEEQQAVYRGPLSSVECIAVLQQRGAALQSFASGQQDGSLCLWSAARKKPVLTRRAAHEGRWIVSLAAMPNSDLLASGSYDGFVRLWRFAPDLSLLEQVGCIATPGFVNGLLLRVTAREESVIRGELIAAVGTEHRLGRWWSTKKDQVDLGDAVCDGATNGIFSYPMMFPAEDEEEEDDNDEGGEGVEGDDEDDNNNDDDDDDDDDGDDDEDGGGDSDDLDDDE
jgi:ribosomal RNA-processing protein 9